MCKREKRGYEGEERRERVWRSKKVSVWERVEKGNGTSISSLTLPNSPTTVTPYSRSFMAYLGEGEGERRNHMLYNSPTLKEGNIYTQDTESYYHREYFKTNLIPAVHYI